MLLMIRTQTKRLEKTYKKTRGRIELPLIDLQSITLTIYAI